MSVCKLTPWRHRQIVELVDAGAHLGIAAARTRVTVRTLQNWLTKGEADGPAVEPFYTFALDVRCAQAKQALRMQTSITESAKTDWKAAAWDLERRFPKLYGQLQKPEREVEFQLAGFLELVQQIVNPEDFNRVLEAANRSADGSSRRALPGSDADGGAFGL